MSTTRLPELPEARIESYQTDGTMRTTKLTTYDEFDMHAYGLAVWKAAMQTAAEAVPTNWCDELLTGKHGIGQPPYHCPDIERLLSKLRAAILALSLPEQGGPQ